MPQQPGILLLEMKVPINPWVLHISGRILHFIELPPPIPPLRFDMDREDDVLYCYDIQLEESVRRKGLGLLN